MTHEPHTSPAAGRRPSSLFAAAFGLVLLGPAAVRAQECSDRPAVLAQSLRYEVSGVDTARGAFSGRVSVTLRGDEACVVQDARFACGATERLEVRGQLQGGRLRAPAQSSLGSPRAGAAGQDTLEVELADGTVRTRRLGACGVVLATAEGVVRPVDRSRWSPSEQREFHHRTQGVNLLPLSWFQALEVADGSAPFAGAENLRRFGIIPDPTQPQGLPVGFAVQGPMVGLNCAACHTSQLSFQGRELRIEGGRGSLDIELFRGALGQALGATAASPEKFGRFAQQVVGSDPFAAQQLGQALRGYLEQARRGAEVAQQLGLRPVAWGFGRVDAFNNGANTIFGPLSPRNLAPVNAPVRLPYLWGTAELSWVQYNAGIRQPLSRNLTASVAAGASLSLTGPTAFETSAKVADVHRLEELMARIEPPRWPGFIDPQGWRRGRGLYAQRCASCHDPRRVRGAYGQMEVDPVLTPLEQIGTDPNNAIAFQRRVDVSAMGLGEMPVTDALRIVTDGIMARQFRELGLTARQEREYTRGRENGFRAPLAYRARPLDGIWAAGPYLHNGSVRTLYQLLSPREERQASFRIGPAPAVDLREVGQVEPAEGFLFRADQPGNANGGHEFRDGAGSGVIGPRLSEAERRDLLEFLKSY